MIDCIIRNTLFSHKSFLWPFLLFHELTSTFL
nr:MAG TPA: hypothetical protein [Caudoviricetes sp.]